MSVKISLIAAVDLNNGIGKNNRLLCHLPADLKKFKTLTTGNNIIMGRKTFESLPNGALPNRKNIVITHNSELSAPGCFVANSPEHALQISDHDKEVFIIGGEQVYKLFIDIADFLYITKIDHAFEADAFFPEIDKSKWKITESIYNEPDEKNLYPFYFTTYSRINK